MVKNVKATVQKGKTVENEGLMGIFKGVVGACLVTVVAFIILAVILTYTNVSESIIAAISVLVTALSAIVAGLFAAKDAKSRGLLWGMGTGLIYVAVVFLVLMTNQVEMNFSLGKITGILCAAAGGGIGGVLGINTKK